MNFKNFLNLPEMEKEGTIKKIDRNKNPILIKIDDSTVKGTEIFLSPSEYRRYKKTGRLEIGSKVKVYLQKHPLDKGNGPFQISGVKFI
jgi:hypothetical protein